MEPPTLEPPDGAQRNDAVVGLFDDWFVEWSAWAADTVRMRPVRDLYRRLFGLCERLGQYPEELEVVVASGCLSWRPPNHPEVRRHLLVMPASLRFDADSGAITLVADEAGPIEFEVDMLDAVLHPRGVFAEIEEQLSSVVTSTLDEGGRRCAPLARAQPRG